ncbi:MAG TPA: aminotransferase class III-fold pyridoxal phosphate-dependent enzyme [bacterium]|nr:aminotransferase class III-fold pyridoxal phosphate-dependent enzyme [bacterium]
MSPRGASRPAHRPPAVWYQGQVQAALARRGGPLRLVRGAGTHVWDADGRKYLDARSGLWAALVGYGRGEIIDAIAAQLRTLSFAPLTDAASPLVETLAERLRTLLPGDLDSLVPVPTGSEAVDTALKFARLFHSAGGHGRRRVIISREYSAHGSTYAGSSLSDPDRGLLRGMGTPLAGIRFVRAPYRFRCPHCAAREACTLACADEVDRAIADAGPDRVAAVFAEPVPGPGGVLVPPAEYWPRVRAICDRHGVLLVADEVVTGFGRTGRWFACDHWDVVPDLMILGKGLTGGYQALAAVALRRHVAERLARRLVPHGFTYSGHPAACAAAMACLRIIEEEGLVDRAATLGARLIGGLAARLRDCPIAGEVRGLGLMTAVELVSDRTARTPLRLGTRGVERLERELRHRGVLCFADNPVILAPPLTITDQNADELAAAAAGAVAALSSERSAAGRRGAARGT